MQTLLVSPSKRSSPPLPRCRRRACMHTWMRPQAVTQRPHFRHFSKSMLIAALLESCSPSSSAVTSLSHSWLQTEDGRCNI